MTIEIPTQVPPTRFRWVVFALCCMTSWMLYLQRYVFSLIMPALDAEYQLGATKLGLLNSAFSFFYSTCQLPMGIAVDALGVHLMLTGMIVIWSLGFGLHAWAPTADHLWYARAAFGTGQSGVFAALSRISRNWFPSNVRTTLQGWFGVFFGRFGGVSANLLIGSLVLGVLGIPWRTAVYGLAVIGLFHAILFALLYRNSPSEHPRVNEGEYELINDGVSNQQRQPSNVREMFRRMTPRSIQNLLFLNVQTILSASADNIFSVWIPLFLAQVHGLNFKEMGIYAALPLMGGALGGATGGWLNDVMIRATGNRRWSRTIVGLAGKGIAGVLLLTAMAWYDNPYRFCGILLFVKFFSDWSLSTTWGAVTDIGGPATASVFAFNNAVGTIGAVLAPTIYGALAEHVGWPQVFFAGAGMYFLCALSWLAFDCTVPIIAENPPTSADSSANAST